MARGALSAPRASSAHRERNVTVAGRVRVSPLHTLLRLARADGHRPVVPTVAIGPDLSRVYGHVAGVAIRHREREGRHGCRPPNFVRQMPGVTTGSGWV